MSKSDKEFAGVKISFENKINKNAFLRSGIAFDRLSELDMKFKTAQVENKKEKVIFKSDAFKTREDLKSFKKALTENTTIKIDKIKPIVPEWMEDLEQFKDLNTPLTYVDAEGEHEIEDEFLDSDENQRNKVKQIQTLFEESSRSDEYDDREDASSEYDEDDEELEDDEMEY